MNRMTTSVSIKLIFILALLSAMVVNVMAGVGESAVITLAFPPGARSTGLGEAFTGCSDDATATYYNPAGLGLAPMANSWKVHLADQNYIFTSIVAEKKKDFSSKSLIWAGTSKGLLRYDGKHWEQYDFYLTEQNDNLEGIAAKYIDSDEENSPLIKKAAWLIQVENGIGMKRFDALKIHLNQAVKNDSTIQKEQLADSLARELLLTPSEDRTKEKIFAMISSSVDSSKADDLAGKIVTILGEKDRELEDCTELKIPFSIAINDSVTALAVDKSDRLWVGTVHGLWRLGDNKWTYFSLIDGLPSNAVRTLAAGPYGELAVGTDNGVALYSNGEWSKKTDSTSALPSTVITALAFGQNDIIYAGTDAGLVKIDKDKFTVYDTADGLLSREVHSLFFDSQKRLWIGSNNGITIFNNVSWKRYQFPNSVINSFAEQDEKTIWIGTDKGAISYTAGKTVTDERGNVTEAPPEWKPFHSKNALSGDDVKAVTVYDKDIWLITESGINQYDVADRQTSIAFELLLPAFKINDLWHAYWTLIWPTKDWGTIGASINYINMGENTITDALGREGPKVRSWEGVFGLSYGLNIQENLALGINAKYVISALAPGLDKNGAGVGQTFAIDAAVLKRKLFNDKFDIGFMFQNMGPDIFYIDEENKDPIPFTLRLGTVYHIIEQPVHDLKFLFDMSKEVVKNHFDTGKPDPFYVALWTDLLNDTTAEEDWKYELQEINYNLGLEYWYTQFLALRTGFLFDYLGERYEWTLGVGIKYNSMILDYSYIHAPEGFLKGILSKMEKGKNGATGARDGQWRFSLAFLF